MNTVFEVQPFVTWLQEILLKGTSRPFGDTKSPKARPESDDFPYGVIEAIPGGVASGPPLVAPQADADLVFQIRSCGLTPEQARWLSDRVRTTLCARKPDGSWQVALDDPTGWVIQGRETAGGPPAAIPEDSYTPTVYNLPERFVLRVTPGG